MHSSINISVFSCVRLLPKEFQTEIKIQIPLQQHSFRSNIPRHSDTETKSCSGLKPRSFWSLSSWLWNQAELVNISAWPVPKTDQTKFQFKISIITFLEIEIASLFLQISTSKHPELKFFRVVTGKPLLDPSTMHAEWVGPLCGAAQQSLIFWSSSSDHNFFTQTASKAFQKWKSESFLR